MWKSCCALLLIACGGTKDPSPPAPVVPSPSPTVAAQPSEPAKPPAAFTRESLPEWPAAKLVVAEAPSSPTEVWAADVDGDRLLMELAGDTNVIAQPANKRISGHIAAVKRADAFAAIAEQLGVDATPLTITSKKVPLVTAASAASEIYQPLREATDAANQHLVFAPGKQPRMNVFVEKVPWDQLMSTIVERAGLSLASSDRTHYVLAKGATLPPLGTYGKHVVSLNVHSGATLAHAAAALEAVTKAKIASCSKAKIGLLMLRDIALAEAVRAIEVASGDKLGTGCAARLMNESDAVADLKAVAYAGKGTDFVVVFDYKGEVVVGVKNEKLIYHIDLERHNFVDNSVAEPFSHSAELTEEWKARPRRTAALVKYRPKKHDRWSAIVEDGTEWLHPAGTTRHSWDPPGVEWVVREDGVRLMITEKEYKLFPLAPK